MAKHILISFLFLCIFFYVQAYSQQKIKDFYLSNLKEDGSRDWEVKGREATIYDKHVDIDEMKANYYLENDTILITSDTARLNKESMDVYLKDNVHIENKEGSTVDTDSLNWQRDKNHIETEDWVEARRDSMQIVGKGLSADMELRKADFKKNVEVTFPDQENKTVITATCDGPLEIEYNLGRAIFNDNVIITHTQGKVFSDKTTLFFDPEEKRIIKIISEGNVKIVREENVAYAQKATYHDSDKRLVLEGRPRLIYFPTKENESGFGSAKKSKDIPLESTKEAKEDK